MQPAFKNGIVVFTKSSCSPLKASLLMFVYLCVYTNVFFHMSVVFLSKQFHFLNIPNIQIFSA